MIINVSQVIILSMIVKAKKQVNSMVTQYFDYGNTVVGISEHQYYQMRQSSKK